MNIKIFFINNHHQDLSIESYANERLKTSIDRLLSGTCSYLKFNQLNLYILPLIPISERKFLIFTHILEAGIKHPCLLETVSSVDESPFIKLGNLSRFLENPEKPLTDDYDPFNELQEIQIPFNSIPFNPKHDQISRHFAFFYNNAYRSLDFDQESALDKNGTSIVHGERYSGKSLTLFAQLQSYLQKIFEIKVGLFTPENKKTIKTIDPQKPQKILYLTHTDEDAAQISEMWGALFLKNYQHEFIYPRFEVYTFNDWIEELFYQNDLPEKQLIGYEEFLFWYQKNNIWPKISPLDLYREFSFYAAFSKNYPKLNFKVYESQNINSRFYQQYRIQPAQLAKTFNAYSNSIPEDCFDPAFMSHEFSCHPYDQIFIDSAEQLSLNQICFLIQNIYGKFSRQSTHGKIHMALDDSKNFRLIDAHQLEKIFSFLNIKSHRTSLHTVHSPIKPFDAILAQGKELKEALIQGTPLEHSSLIDDPAQNLSRVNFQWISCSEVELKEQLSSFKEKKSIVLTSGKFINLASEIFPFNTVLNISKLLDEAYDEIILFQCMNHQSNPLRRLSELLASSKNSPLILEHKNQIIQAIDVFLKQITRAKAKLTIIQINTGIEALIEVLNPSKNNVLQECIRTTTPKPIPTNQDSSFIIEEYSQNSDSPSSTNIELTPPPSLRTGQKFLQNESQININAFFREQANDPSLVMQNRFKDQASLENQQYIKELIKQTINGNFHYSEQSQEVYEKLLSKLYDQAIAAYGILYINSSSSIDLNPIIFNRIEFSFLGTTITYNSLKHFNLLPTAFSASHLKSITPLMGAIFFNRKANVEQMIALGADVNEAFHQEQSWLDILNGFIKPTFLNPKSHERYLSYQSLWYLIELLPQFFHKNPFINLEELDHYHQEHLAFLKSRSLDPEQVFQSLFRSPLSLAIIMKHYELIKLLIKAGASISIPICLEGMTAKELALSLEDPILSKLINEAIDQGLLKDDLHSRTSHYSHLKSTRSIFSQESHVSDSELSGKEYTWSSRSF